MSFIYFLPFLWSLASGSLITPSIWPLPQSFIFQNTSLPLSSKFQSEIIDPVSRETVTISTLTNALERYQKLIFPEISDEGKEQNAPNLIQFLQIFVDNLSEDYPQLATDESYTLTVNTSATMTITSNTVYGALRAIESLSQLVVFNYEEGIYEIPGCPIEIIDAPRYPHRGLLLDTSRHYQPLSAIKRTIDSLSYAKYNGLTPHPHLHSCLTLPLFCSSPLARC
jgi:hexosaminidase